MKKLIVGLVGTFLCLVNSHAAGVQSLPMLQGQDTLRLYALESVTHGSRGLSSASMDWDYDKRFSYTNNVMGTSAEEILAKLLDVDFVYKLKNTNDAVSGYIYLYDAKENLVFFGSANYFPSKGETAQFGLWMQGIALLDDVQYAEILPLKEDGTTADSIQVNVQNGHLMFQPYYAGVPNGILAVKKKDGTLLTFDLWDPVANTPGAVSETDATGMIEGHHIFATSDKDVYVVKIVESWVRPTAFISVKKGQIVKFDVSGIVQMNAGTQLEKASSVTFEQVGGPWGGASNLTGDQPQITFPAAGTYRLKFGWVNFGKANALYTGPNEKG